MLGPMHLQGSEEGSARIGLALYNPFQRPRISLISTLASRGREWRPCWIKRHCIPRQLARFRFLVVVGHGKINNRKRHCWP
jgi:hypothetical protein